MAAMKRAVCARCVHFRHAPYEAKHEGCYLPGNMKSKQKESYLDEQQLPGDHEAINLRGDCPDYLERPAKPSLWRRLLADVG